MSNEFSFDQLLALIRRRYKDVHDFTDYCVEESCMNVVRRYGMFCEKHNKGE